MAGTRQRPNASRFATRRGAGPGRASDEVVALDGHPFLRERLELLDREDPREVVGIEVGRRPAHLIDHPDLLIDDARERRARPIVDNPRRGRWPMTPERNRRRIGVVSVANREGGGMASFVAAYRSRLVVVLATVVLVASACASSATTSDAAPSGATSPAPTASAVGSSPSTPTATGSALRQPLGSERRPAGLHRGDAGLRPDAGPADPRQLRRPDRSGERRADLDMGRCGMDAAGG